MKNKQGLQGANRLLFFQLAVMMLMVVVMWSFLGSTAARSAWFGGMVSLLPTAYFARKLFQRQGAHAAKQMVNRFYRGEAVKLILSIFLFTAVFKFFNIVPLVFFAVYMMVQSVFWFSPLLFASK